MALYPNGRGSRLKHGIVRVRVPPGLQNLGIIQDMKRFSTDAEFIEAVRSSLSIREVLTKLDVVPAGGNYATFHRRVARLELDTSHFLGKGSNLGKSFPAQQVPIEDYLRDGTNITSHKLRLLLIKNEIKEAKCESCGLIEWLNSPIPLELDHINGKSDDNRLENLRILCPNCHALTPTYRGKNKSKSGSNECHLCAAKIPKPYKHCISCLNEAKQKPIELKQKPTKAKVTSQKTKTIKPNPLCYCGNTKSGTAQTCLDCYNEQKSSNIPNKESLLSTLTELSWNFSAAGRHYSVSDNAVRKWVRKSGLSKPTEDDLT